jgi:hypothetical protein
MELARYFMVDEGPFAVGDRVVWQSRDAGGRPYHSLERTRLRGIGDSASWRFRQATNDSEQEWEVVLSAEGLPSQLRFRDPATGALEERGAVLFWDTRAVTALKREAATPVAADGALVLASPVVIGEEVIEVGAGVFSAIHLTDAERAVDYWLSPEIPGGIVRIKTHLPDGGATVTELVEWSRVGD